MATVSDSLLRRVLRDKDLQKLSVIMHLDLATLQHFNDLCLLNYDYIREVLIKNDWRNLTGGLSMLEDSNKAYTFPEIKAAICNEYRETPQYVNAIIATRQNHILHFCAKCGVRLEPGKRKMGIELCNECSIGDMDIK